MLLTSSQVSFAVSAGVVVLCTFALFLSGYAIQQRTLNQLRQSIREPRPEPPKMFLPDRFKAMTTELEDGSVVTIDDTDDDGVIVAANAPSHRPPVEMHVSSVDDARQQRLALDVLGDTIDGTLADTNRPQQPVGPALAPPKPVGPAERRRRIKEELIRLSHNPKPVYYQRRLY